MDNNKKYIYGRNPVNERLKIIKNGILFVKKNIHESSVKEIIYKAKSKNLTIEFKDSSFFENLFPEKTHQGIALEINEDFISIITLEILLEKIKENKKSIILILDGVEDVGNLGAAIRSALLFNADAVILPKHNTSPINDIVVKRSAGAVNFIDIIYATNLVNEIEKLKKAGYWVYAADISGDKIITQTEFHEKSVIVIGDESKGIRKLVKENCDFKVIIPTNNKIDSLNLSVSVGIFLYEVNRQLFQK
jgi:23S rRNA (guanosine2251-2'-O)-methyltransferase